MQQLLRDLAVDGPDWPNWINANHWRHSTDWHEPFVWGDNWATRMEGAVYLICWNASGWSLYRYLGEPTIGEGETIKRVELYSNRKIEEAMRWVMETLPARIVIWTL